MHTLIVVLVALAVLAGGFAFGLVVLGKRADQLAQKALQRQDTSFPAWMKEWEKRAQDEKEGRSMLL
jgi:hypothetical protein